MSRNWRIPASPARYRTARVRKDREVRATSMMLGNTSAYCWPAALFTRTGVLPALAFSGHVESRPEVLEGFGVIAAFGGRRAQYGGESVPGHAEPIGPGTEFTRVVQQGLTDVEDHSLNRHSSLSLAGLLAKVNPPTPPTRAICLWPPLPLP